MICNRCSIEFIRKPKAVRQIYCSKKCNQAAYEERQGSRIAELRKANYDANKNRYRSYKEKWNQSSKGKANRKQWYENHKQEQIARMKAKPDYLLNLRFSKQAKRVLLRHKAKICENCATRVGIIDAHHKTKPRSNNSIENLAWLCRVCHARTHIIR
jgi:hypothetical protein